MTGALARFPEYRPRRMRRKAALRRLVQETSLQPRQLLAPLFVVQASRKREEIPSMPGIFRLGLAEAVQEAKELHRRRVGGVLLFGIPRTKDARGTPAYSRSGVVQEAVRAIKKAVPELVVITDVCLCEYTSHGHCGVLKGGTGKTRPP